MNRSPVLSVSLVTAAMLLSSVRTASADEIVTATGKGIAGGALLGAEVVVLAESALGVRSPWAHVAGAGAGAIGGGIGGYFLEQSVDDGRIPLSLLAGGFVLLIPTVVLSLNATSYAASDAPVETQPSAPPPPPAVVGFARGELRAGMPIPSVSNVFSAADRRQYGMQQQTQVQVPVLHVSF